MPERLTDEERRRFEEIRALDEGSRAAAGAKGGA
jgi:hypothetical protein